jgi:hypothetical protein
MIAELGLTVIGIEALTADPAAAATTALGALAGCDHVVLHLDIDVVDFLTLPLSQRRRDDDADVATVSLTMDFVDRAVTAAGEEVVRCGYLTETTLYMPSRWCSSMKQTSA